MVSKPSQVALGRIESALASIEKAITRGRSGNLPQLSAIEANNQRLREALSQTLQQIDALIDHHGGATPLT